jgi:membrane protein YqaA with SNARE-associated domain
VDDLAAYGGLFAAALLAATILPAQSEAVLGFLDASGAHDPGVLLLVAAGKAARYAVLLAVV